MTTSVSTAYQTQHDLLRRTPAYLISFEGVDEVFGTHHLIGESSDIDDTVDIDFTLDTEYAYDTEDGAEQYYNDIFDGAAFVETIPQMQLPRGISAQVEPDKGRSTIGSITFVITDEDGAATALIAQGIGGRVATFKAGFDNILEGEFATFFTGIVSSYKLTSDLTGYEITCRDPQTLLNKQIFECAATKLTAVLTQASADTFTHYLRLVDGVIYTVTNALTAAAYTTLLDSALGAGNWSFSSAAVASVGSTITVADTQFFLSAGYVKIDNEIIQYTGKTATTFTGLTRGSLGTTATAHAVDASAGELLRIGPASATDIIQTSYTNTDKTGLSIAAALVSAATFNTVETSLGSHTLEFRITGRMNAQRFLEDELFGVIACYPIVTGAGLLSIREFTEPTSGASVSTIDHDSIVADADGKPILGGDGNFSKLINKVTYYYDFNPVTGEYDSHYTAKNQASIDAYSESPLVIYAKGLRSDLASYQSTAPIIKARCFLQKNLIEPGEVVSVTSALLPNRFTGTRGITAALFEVINRSMVFDQGHVDFELLWN